jgi:hypothetical protein
LPFALEGDDTPGGLVSTRSTGSDVAQHGRVTVHHSTHAKAVHKAVKKKAKKAAKKAHVVKPRTKTINPKQPRIGIRSGTHIG